MKASLQLYSLRDEVSKDFSSTVRRVGDLGYFGVEFAGFGGLAADEMKDLLAKSNLKAIGSHSSIQIFRETAEKELAYLKEIGAEYMVCPGAQYPNGMEDVLALCKTLNEVSEKAKAYGIKVGYHNHAHEFETIDGKYILDLIAENTNDDVILEVDVFWVSYAGIDPFAYIEKWGKKVELIHIKQINDDKFNVDVEDGNISIPDLVKTAKYATNFIVEQEQYVVSPWDSVIHDAAYLNRL